MNASSVRYLRRRPLLVWLSVGTLGVGLGVASTLFGVVNALYLRPLPVDPGKRVMVVRGVQATQGLTDESISRQDMTELLANSASVEAFGGLRDWGPALFVNDRPEPIEGIVATASTFEVFDVKPHLGRLFTAGDDVPGKNRVLLLTHRAWTRRFGADREVVGRSINLDGQSFTIIGVLPERLTAPRFADAEFWAPLSNDSDYDRGRAHRNLLIYAKLADGADRRTFAAELLGRSQTLAARYAETNAGWTARAIPLIEYELAGVLPRLLLLGAAAALLLLMACANMASLIFAESMARGSEYGLRAALGGSTWHLWRQLFADHLLLCLAGGTSAVVIASTLLAFTGRFVTADIPRLGEVRPDAAVVVFAVAVSLLLAVVFAAISVWWATRDEPARHIRLSERSVTHAAPRWVSHVLVGTQAALALLLLWSGLSFGRAYHKLATASPGFDTRGLLLVRVQAVERMNRRELTGRSIAALEDLRALPGVESATIASSGPLFGGREDIELSTDAMSEPVEGRYANVDASFFDCLRIPIVAGAAFTRADDGSERNVLVLSRSLAKRLFPRGDAVGKVVLMGNRRFPHTVVGIAADADEAKVANGGIDVYIPFTQDARRVFFIAVRGATVDTVSDRLRRSLPGFMVLSTATLDDTIDKHLLEPRLQVLLLGLFAIGAAVLAAVAVFGMVTRVATSRAGEMGLRLALGATPRQTQLLLLRAVALPVLVALTIALPLARKDALPAAIAVSIIVALTLVASWKNVRTLARQEPIETLRAM